MKEASITYYDKPGKQNTNDVLKKVRERLIDSDIRYVVLASSRGQTALKAYEILKDLNIEIVVVTLHAGFKEPGKIEMSKEKMDDIISKGMKLHMGSHSLSGVGRSISKKFGGTTPVEIIANTLRTFCGHGLKVCIEIAVMAADAGLIPTDEEILTIGGTHGGADTALIIQSPHMNNFFDLQVKEIIAKPRTI